MQLVKYDSGPAGNFKFSSNSLCSFYCSKKKAFFEVE
jgi:hypothetical protein